MKQILLTSTKILLFFVFFNSTLYACNSVSPNARVPTGTQQPTGVVPANTGTRTQQNTGSFSWSGQFSISNSDVYRDVLRAYRVCDRWSLWNFGTSSCNAWDDYSTVVLTFQNRQLPAQATLSIRPHVGGWSVGGRNNPSFFPLVLRGEARPIFDYDGFQARLVGGVNTANNNNQPIVAPGPIPNPILSPIIARSVTTTPSDNHRDLDVEFFYSNTRDDNLFGYATLTNSGIDDGLGTGSRNTR